MHGQPWTPTGKGSRVMFISSGFPTERWEMEIVASKFERDGLIDYKEFVNSLKDKKPVSGDGTNLSS